MNTTKLTCLALSAAMLSGCASMGRGSSYVPLVDTQGKDATVLATDIAECQAFARQRADAAIGAAAGAIAVGLLGAFLAPRGYRNQVAGRAAVLGALGGGSEAGNTQEDVIKRCLSGRGYVVLN